MQPIQNLLRIGQAYFAEDRQEIDHAGLDRDKGVIVTKEHQGVGTFSRTQSA